MGDTYYLIVVGSGFAGTMATLNFLETCARLKKSGHVALVEAGKALLRKPLDYGVLAPRQGPQVRRRLAA